MEAKAPAASDERRGRARRRLEDVTAQAASTPEFGHREIEDRILSVSEGYEEVQRISESVLRGPQLPMNVVRDESTSTAVDSDTATRQTLFGVARSTAGKGAKFAVDGGKRSVAKFKQRRGQMPEE